MSKVLLVDDEPRVLRALTAALSSAHNIQTSNCVSDAVKMIQSESPFDAIISDEIMPEARGHELLNWCIENSPESKRIVLTGLPITSELKNKFKNFENVDVFTKPWKIDQIELALKDPNADQESSKAGEGLVTAEKLQEETTIDLNKPIKKFLVVETDDKYKKLYAQLETNNLGEVGYCNSYTELIESRSKHPEIEQVILDISNNASSYSEMINLTHSHYSSARIIITATPKLAQQLRPLISKLSRTELIVKPFSFKRLLMQIST